MHLEYKLILEISFSKVVFRENLAVLQQQKNLNFEPYSCIYFKPSEHHQIRSTTRALSRLIAEIIWIIGQCGHMNHIPHRIKITFFISYLLANLGCGVSFTRLGNKRRGTLINF